MAALVAIGASIFGLFSSKANDTQQKITNTVNQDIQSKCTVGSAAFSYIDGAHINITNSNCANANLSIIANAKAMGMSCVQSQSVDVLQDAAATSKQLAENFNLSGENASKADISQALNQSMGEVCENTVTATAIVENSSIDITGSRCDGAILAIQANASTNCDELPNAGDKTTCQDSKKVACQLNLISKATQAASLTSDQENKGWDPLAFLNTLAGGLKYAAIAIVLIIGLVFFIFIILVLVKVFRKKPDAAAIGGPPGLPGAAGGLQGGLPGGLPGGMSGGSGGFGSMLGQLGGNFASPMGGAGGGGMNRFQGGSFRGLSQQSPFGATAVR
jgi:hypothetical protein